MKRRNTWIVAIGCSIALLVAATFSMAAEGDDNGPPDRPGARDSGPGGPGEQHQKVENQKFGGTVAQFNFTPRGERDGILLTSDGKLVQLNFSPRDASKLSGAISVGDQISAEAAPERAHADHAVCRLQKLTTASGKEISMGGPQRSRRNGDSANGRRNEPGDRRPTDAAQGPSNGPPDRPNADQGPDAGPGPGPGGDQGSDNGPGGPRRAADAQGSENAQGPGGGPQEPDQGPDSRRRQRVQGKTETLKGVVKYLNHTPRGEVDGALLESGDFIHTGPREATEAKLAVGAEVSAEGLAMKMPDGHKVIEFPRKINDKAVSRPPMPGRRGGGFVDRQPAGPPGEGPPQADDK
jgi:hypothetical protein